MVFLFLMLCKPLNLEGFIHRLKARPLITAIIHYFERLFKYNTFILTHGGNYE